MIRDERILTHIWIVQISVGLLFGHVVVVAHTLTVTALRRDGPRYNTASHIRIPTSSGNAERDMIGAVLVHLDGA